LKGEERSYTRLSDPGSCLYHVSVDGGESASSLISPCGLVAWSFFNDSFALFNQGGSQIGLVETGIAWPSDLANKFRNSANGSTGLNFPQFAEWRSRTCAELPSASQVAECEAAGIPDAGWCYPNSGYCVEDEHFVIWMRAAAMPNFRKLYAVINTALEPGTYSVRVSNGMLRGGAYMNADSNHTQSFLYPVSTFGGTKAIVLSTTTWMGGRNYFLGYTYVVVGVICLTLALCFFIKYKFSNQRKMGESEAITWRKGVGPIPHS